MKKYISCLLTLALFIPALVSCTRELQDNRSQNNKHLVYFSTSNPETRTGLTIDEGVVYPFWSDTDLGITHFFEIPVNGGEVEYGEAVGITTTLNNTVAHFTASFSKDMTITVNPPTRADGESNMYYYGAVVAQKPGEDFTFEIPAVQNPKASTKKDPDAEFLIGYSRKAHEVYEDGDNVVDLYFDRVAALGRLSFTNFQKSGELVKSVKINSTEGLVGSASYSDITFGDENTVNFTRTEGPLTLSFDDGRAIPTEGVFEAYFVIIPGEATITSIEVETDKYKYTKEIAGGKKFEFSKDQFKNINVDLSDATVEEVASVWYKASVLEAGYDYIIVSQGKMLNNGADGLTGEDAPADNAGVIEFESAPTASVIWTAATLTGLEEYGHFTLSNDGKYLYRYSNQQTQNMTVGSLPNEPTKHYVWDYDGTYLYHVSSTSEDRIFYCYYNNGWATDYTQSNAKPVAIYTTRAPQEISFPEGPYEYNLDDPTVDFQEPALSEHFGDVTYSSSDESMATVAADGNVTFLKAGQVTITAVAAGDAEHQAASASYTINISSSQVLVYHKVSSTADLEVGAKYILVYEQTPSVFKPILESDGNSFQKAKANVIETEISAGTISSSDFEACHFTLENGYYLKSDQTGKYLYPAVNSSNRGLLSAESTPSHQLTIAFADGIAKIQNGDYYLVWSSNSSNLYFSSGNSVSGSYYDGICLYKLDDGRQAQNPTFNPPGPFTIDKATQTFTAPELQDYHGDVTYMSDNESVATVNANTGAVEIVGRGEVVISATIKGDANYKSATASYELTVTDSSLQSKTYRKVTSTTELTVGSKYLLVFEGLPGDTDGDGDPKVFKPILESSGNTFQKHTDNALAVTISSNTITSSDFENCHLTLETGYYLKADDASRYIYPSKLSSGSGALAAEATASNALNITLSDGIASIKPKTGKYTNYSLVWSTYSHYFSSSSGSNSTGICLYKLDDGTVTPTESQTLEFDGNSAEFDLIDGGRWVTEPPTLNETGSVVRPIEWSSSATTVAEVDQNGNVTIPLATAKKGDTAIITATAPAGTVSGVNYSAASASYTITISDSSPVETVTVQLKKATALTAGQKYVLVSNGFALMKDGDDASVVAFNANDLTITVPSTSVDDVKWTLEQKSGSITRGNEYVFSNGTYYFGIAMNTNNQQTYTYTVEVSNGRTVSTNVSIQDHNINLTSDYIYYRGNSSSYYIFYNTSSGIWDNEKVSSSSTPASTSKTALYVVDDGSNPGGGDDPEPTITTYTRISAHSELVSGTYLIVSVNNTNLVFKGGTGSGSASGEAVSATASPLSMSDNTITITGDSNTAKTYEYVITRTDDSITLKGELGYLKRNTGNSTTYIGYEETVTSASTFTVNTNPGTHNSGDDAVFFSTKNGSNDEYLYYNTSGYFKIGGSGAPTTSSSKHGGVFLYKKVENP